MKPLRTPAAPKFSNSEQSLFKYLQLFVISNGTDTRYFANTTRRDKNSFDFTMNWAKADIRREFATDNGTELNAILPKMSPLNPQYLKKKQSVFEKIAMFVEKFKRVGGQI